MCVCVLHIVNQLERLRGNISSELRSRNSMNTISGTVNHVIMSFSLGKVVESVVCLRRHTYTTTTVMLVIGCLTFLKCCIHMSVRVSFSLSYCTGVHDIIEQGGAGGFPNTWPSRS